jgi:ADP-ribosylglycohydrolase
MPSDDSDWPQGYDVAKLGLLDATAGCFMGGAVGDALGYPVEFLSHREIVSRFGPAGIESFELDRESGLALVSDDTQMSLFTAYGLMSFVASSFMGSGHPPVERYLHHFYLDWLSTQGPTLADDDCWLLRVDALHSRRAPGSTCLSALSSGAMGTIESPINHSKGCGGVMRVAPAGCCRRWSGSTGLTCGALAARAAAITHGHPLGWLPAALLARTIHAIVFDACDAPGLEEAMSEGIVLVSELASTSHIQRLAGIMDEAVRLSRNSRPDTENIAALGQGWVAEEALAIAFYCCLRYREDFSSVVRAAVNHDGDSDSTGAIAGNICGAIVGCDGIPSGFKESLELRDVILDLSREFNYGCQGTDQVVSIDEDVAWIERYGRLSL